MKITGHRSIYFSAYPLKATIEEVPVNKTPQVSPYLKSVLSGKTRTASKSRILPMVNPYKHLVENGKKIIHKFNKDIELKEKEWYNNYE